MDKEIKLGSVVKAIAGRDEGYYFLVISVIDENYVLLANGKNRTLAKPKRKKLKHIKATGFELNGIAAKIEENKQVFDKEIVSALRACIEK